MKFTTEELTALLPVRSIAVTIAKKTFAEINQVVSNTIEFAASVMKAEISKYESPDGESSGFRIDTIGTDGVDKKPVTVFLPMQVKGEATKDGDTLKAKLTKAINNPAVFTVSLGKNEFTKGRAYLREITLVS